VKPEPSDYPEKKVTKVIRELKELLDHKAPKELLVNPALKEHKEFKVILVLKAIKEI